MVRRPADAIGKYSLMHTREGWIAFWYVDDRRRRARLGLPASTSLTEAKASFAKWVRAREAALAQDQGITVGKIMDLYIEDRRIEGKRADKMDFQWRAMKPHFEALQPIDLETKIIVDGEKRTRCHQYALTRSEAGRARPTINSELSLLRSAMHWAAANKHADPVRVWVPSAGKPRRTALRPDQIIKLLGAIVEAPHHIRLLMLIALATGARRQAILDLTWDRIDLDRRVIDFRTPDERSILDTGHEKGRAIVDIGDGLFEALSEAKEWRRRTTYVIEFRGRRLKDPKEGVKAVFDAAGLSGRYMGLHALRHTLATEASAAGIDMRRVQKMLGHSDIKTTEDVYAEFRAGYLSAVAGVADAHIRHAGSLREAGSDTTGSDETVSLLTDGTSEKNGNNK